MIAALLIAFREGLEAALIVGIVLGYLNKTGDAARRRDAWVGVILAVILSALIALMIQAVGAKLEGKAEQIFEGVTMLLAVGVLTWMVFWMRYQARFIKSSLEHDIDAAGAERKWGLTAVTFLAVFREGVETALFLSAAAFASDGLGTLTGALIGLALAAITGYLIYASSVRLNMKRFFNVTTVLLLIFAAGLFAHGVHEFQEAGLLPLVTEHVWDTNHLFDESSSLGEIIRAVFGYNGNPSLLEVIAYWGYWVVALSGVRWWVDRKGTRLLTLAANPA
jgi:high-affinity iron transporter